MVVKGVPYINPEGYLFLDQKRKLGLVKRIKKQIDKFGLTNQELGWAVEPMLGFFKNVSQKARNDTILIWNKQ